MYLEVPVQISNRFLLALTIKSNRNETIMNQTMMTYGGIPQSCNACGGIQCSIAVPP